MTLTDPNPVSKVRIFEVEYQKMAHLKDKVTIAQEEPIPNIRDGTIFGDLD